LRAFHVISKSERGGYLPRSDFYYRREGRREDSYPLGTIGLKLNAGKR